MARKDKARYEMEKSMYTGPWKVPAKKRSQKDPNAPKRPMSAFLSFSNSKRSYVKEKYPNVGNAEISRILAQMWKDATPEERKDHVDKEFKLRQEYKTAIAEWRRNSEMEIQTARKEREDQAMKAVLEGKPLGGVQEQQAPPHHEPHFQEDSENRARQQEGDLHRMHYGHHIDSQYHHQGVAAIPPSAQAASHSPYYLPPQSHHHSYYSQQHAHHPYPSYYNEHNGSYMDYYPGVYPAAGVGAIESSATTTSVAGYGGGTYYHDQTSASSMYPEHSYPQDHQYHQPGYGAPPHASHHASHHDVSSENLHHHDQSGYPDQRNSENHHHGTY